MFRSPLLWVFVIVVIAGSVLLFRRFRTNEWGFKEVLKNPAFWKLSAEVRRSVDEDKAAAQAWSDEQIARAVTYFAFEVKTSSDAWGEKRVLESLAPRIHAPILKILGDESIRRRLTTPTGKNILPEAPFNRLCELIDMNPPPQVVGVLSAFLRDPSEDIRKDAALVLGSSGTAEIIEPLRIALTDPDEYVCSYALIGLQRAYDGGRLDGRCKRELFDDIWTMVSAGREADKASGLLLDFDRARATELFLSPTVFTAETRWLHSALEAMADRKVIVPRHRLLELVENLEAGELQYPKTYLLKSALRLLGQNKNPADRPMLEAKMSHPERDVAEGASAGLLASLGLEDFEKRLWDEEKASGFDALPDRKKHVLAVSTVDGEVNNGGHSQYFLNSSGDQWPQALAGLDAMELKERALIFREAIAKFGDKGPSTNRDARQEELARLIRNNEEAFEDQDKRYYAAKEVIEVAKTRYVIQDADLFR
jgi:hypothetical protein